MAGDISIFNCTLCGECCRGDQMVWLNPIDLKRLARHLNLSDSDELIDRRIIVVEAAEYGIRRPRLRFPPTPVGAACRFLINDLDENGRLRGKCVLHGTQAKPLICRLAPLSRELDLNDGSEEWIEIPPVIGCPGWDSDPPPPEGRAVSPPELETQVRTDLDGETEYFRLLSKS